MASEESTIAPPCVIVLGMHRSGTSLLAGSLEAAGLYLGTVNNEAPFNRKGNKENEQIRDLNDALFNRNDTAWNQPPQAQLRWCREDEVRARSLLCSYRSADRPWGFKDPRTIWTVEGWLRLVPRAHLVGVFRHPSLVVQSLILRTGALAVGENEAIEIWCAYNAELLRLKQKYRFLLIHLRSVETLHEDFFIPLACFTRSIGLVGPIDQFFDSNLLHQQSTNFDPTPKAEKIYGRLLDASKLDLGTS